MKCDHAKLQTLLKKARSVESLYKLAPESDSLAIDTMAEAAVDPGRMSARFVISTPSTDRSGDEVSPEGCVLTNYKKNPLVLWEHGFSQHGMLPLGKSEDEQGNLTVEVSPQAVIGTCFFSRSDPFAEQVFGLIAEKIIRGASVRLQPLAFTHGANGLAIGQWDLEEWSVVGIPCNPEAVAKTVRDGKVGALKLNESLLKSLSRWVPTPAATSRGWTPPVLEKSTMSKAKAKAAPEEEVVDEAVVEEEVPTEEEVVEDDMPKAAKPGATMLSSMGLALKGMADALEEEMKNQENPTVLEYGAGALEGLRKMCDECAGKLKEAYPDHSPEEPEEEEEPVVKSLARWVAKNHPNTSLQLRGLAHSLDVIAKSSGLTKSQKDTLGRAAKALTKAVDGAKEIVEAKRNAPLPESVLKAANDLDENLKRAKQLMPAGGRRQ